MKRIFFIKPLIEKLRSQTPPKVSYRKARSHGIYKAYSGGRFHPKDEGITVEFYKSEEVDPRNLTDHDAQLAGILTAKELLKLFKHWYGDVPAKMYRNWLRIVENAQSSESEN
jgi:hypothetical protein